MKARTLAAMLCLVAGSAWADPATYAFVLLAQGTSGATVPIVRAVVDAPNAACPSISAGKTQYPMQARTNPSPANFPITVCEALMPSAKSLAIGKIALPKVDTGTTPNRVIVMGYSGCRNDSKQSCDAASCSWARVVIACSFLQMIRASQVRARTSAPRAPSWRRPCRGSS